MEESGSGLNRRSFVQRNGFSRFSSSTAQGIFLGTGTAMDASTVVAQCHRPVHEANELDTDQLHVNLELYSNRIMTE